MPKKSDKKPVSWAVFLKNLDQLDDLIKQVKRLGCSAVEFVDRVSLELACENFPKLGISKQAETMVIVEFDEKIYTEYQIPYFKLLYDKVKKIDKENPPIGPDLNQAIDLRENFLFCIPTGVGKTLLGILAGLKFRTFQQVPKIAVQKDSQSVYFESL